MANVKGKDNYLKMPQLNGVDIIPPAGTLGQILAKTSVLDYDLEWINLPDIGSGGSPAAPAGSLQFNTAGAFDGSADMIRNDTDRTLEIRGVAETNMVNVGNNTLLTNGTTSATFYVEVESGGQQIDGMVTYFNRNSTAPNIGGWISYAYDGSTPYIALVDEDDDPPYITFDTLGTGTIANPEFSSSFGAFGPVAGVDLGFSWKENGTEVASLTGGTMVLTGVGAEHVIQNSSTDQFSRSLFGLTNITAGTGGVDRRIFLLEKDSAGAAGESTLILRRESGADFLDYMRMLGTDNNISFNSNRTAGAPAYGDVRIENGQFVIANGQLQQEVGAGTEGHVLTSENTSGRAAWRPRLEIVKTTNTNTTQNFNTTSYSIIPLCGTEVFNNGVSNLYDVDTSTNRITVAETGWYKVSYGMYITSTGTRNLINMQVHVNGLPVGNIQNSYIRNGSGDNHGAMFCDELLQITAGQEVDVRGIRNSNNTTATTLGSSGTSFLQIERVE